MTPVAPDYLLKDDLAYRLMSQGLTEDQAYDIAERAAIMEHDAKVSRPLAEHRAVRSRAQIHSKEHP